MVKASPETDRADVRQTWRAQENEAVVSDIAEKSSCNILPQRDIQRHHDGESGHCAERGEIGIAGML